MTALDTHTAPPMQFTVHLTDDQIPMFAAALAPQLARELRRADTTPLPGEPDWADPDTPYPVTAIRQELGRRGRPMAHLTFQKNYLETGLLKRTPGPNRKQLYVRLGDWLTLKAQTEQKKNK